jgi:SAM-dependent methyltransferase
MAMINTITREDVVEGYRLLLGRDPESEAVIEAYLAEQLTLWPFLKLLAGSSEGVHHAVDYASGYFIKHQGIFDIDVDFSPEERSRLIKNTEEAWLVLGQTDPYWSVLTDNFYRADALTLASREQFYGTGAAEVEVFESACVRNGLKLNRDGTVLDLGCGVGRVGEHFARSYSKYIGVDISTAHLEIARERFSLQRLSNTTLMQLSAFLNTGPDFDILYSVLTLQHNPPPIMLSVLSGCFERLRPGGCAFFQLPCYLYEYEFRHSSYLSRERADWGVEMHALPQPYVFRTLAEHGMVPVEVVPYPRIGPIGFSYAFFSHKPVKPVSTQIQAEASFETAEPEKAG